VGFGIPLPEWDQTYGRRGDVQVNLPLATVPLGAIQWARSGWGFQVFVDKNDRQHGGRSPSTAPAGCEGGNEPRRVIRDDPGTGLRRCGSIHSAAELVPRRDRAAAGERGPTW